MLGRPLPAADRLAAARALVRAGRDRLDELFAGCDVIVAPPALGPAPQGLDSTGDASMNSVWTALGMPAVCIPVLHDADGLPVGVQVIARPGDDAGALAIAGWLEQGLRLSAVAG
jgi:Asp-tRNA(Asn)/Glu-tRNA(Gln) amidotransferase A subunit family amidase